ncbi:MAG: extracellular solute-binding protein [Halanaerobiaceae bacterium]
MYKKLKRSSYVLFVMFFVLVMSFSLQASTFDSMEIGENGPVEIEYWHIQATIYGEAVNEIVKEFNQDYAGKIKVNEIFQGSYNDLNKKIRASIMGGGLPNVAMAYEGDTLEYMKTDKIVILNKYIDSNKYGVSKEEMDDIMDGVLARQNIPQYSGKTMSWPHGNSSMGIYYNKDLLSKAGYDRPAETWKEFEKQVISIYEKTGVPALAIGSGNLGGSFKIWLRTYGINPVSEDGKSVNFDNPHAVELLTILDNMLESGAVYFADNTEQEFTNGSCVFEIGTTARTSTKIQLIKDKFDWGITLIPQGTLKTKSTGLWGGNHVMFKSTPEKQLASWIFMKYFAGSKAQSIYGAKTGYFPATISSQDISLLKTNYTVNPQKRQAFEEVFPYARITVPSAASRAIDNAVGKAIELTLKDNVDPAKAVRKAHLDANKVLKQYQ